MSVDTSAAIVDTWTWQRWTTTCQLVVTDATALNAAVNLAHDVMNQIEWAIDAYNPASELRQLRPGSNRISPILAWFLDASLEAAMATDGLVDPAVFSPSVRWSDIELHGEVLTIPHGAQLDLGATGKAAAADLVAGLINQRLNIGVLLNLGGDIATAGPGPADGWQVAVRDIGSDPVAGFALMPEGAVATSSTLHRTVAGDRDGHHIVDPRTGRSADGPWRTATVVARSCAKANTASTAAIIHGRSAVSWLTERGLPARLVDHDGAVVTLNGFPEEDNR